MFSQKKVKIAFNIFLFIVGIFAIIQMPLIGLPILGGVITQGILGGFTGKVGPVVGAKWKSIDYMRGYIVPSNPNTLAQQTSRTKFSRLVDYARQILGTVLQPFWDIYYTNQSGFNAFIGQNYSTLDVNNDLTLSSKVSKGTLAPQPITSAVYTSVNGALVLDWTPVVGGNALTDDELIMVVSDKSSNTLYQYAPLSYRDDGSVNVGIPTGLTATNLIVFVFFFQGTGSAMIVSDSDSVQATA